MLAALGTKVKESLGSDAYAGLMGMFLFLHFYYAVPVYGWQRALSGIVVAVVSIFFLSFIAFWAGNGLRAAMALIAAALALDFFYRGQVGRGGEQFVFEYLTNGPAVINFASFGLASTWLFSQLDPGV
jgi:hypothetical protein